ncbi:MAG: FkbM family methyltransferase [Thermoflexales bacterium]|nr:FkbM family methyltransferase [Thermoflexales bacterium]
MTLLRRLTYYARSIPVALLGFSNPLQIALAAARRSPFVAHLRNGARFSARSAMDAWVIKETCLDRDYERAGATLKDGDTVVDIGAGLGDFAISVARRFPRARVLAFEPFGESFGLLQRNIAENGLNNVEAHRMAIGASRGEVRLSLETGVAVQHSTVREGGDLGEHIEQRPLGEALESLGATRCDFLKLDCEGAEYDILQRAAEDGTLDRIGTIAMEYHDGVTHYSGAWLANLLRQRGFGVVLRRNPAHDHIGFLYAVRSA